MGTVAQCNHCKKFFKVPPNSEYNSVLFMKASEKDGGEYSCVHANLCPECKKSWNRRLAKK